METNEFTHLEFIIDYKYVPKEDVDEYINRHIKHEICEIENIRNKIGLESESEDSCYGLMNKYHADFLILSKENIENIFEVISNTDDKEYVHDILFGINKYNKDMIYKDKDKRILILEKRKEELKNKYNHTIYSIDKEIEFIKTY